MRLGAGKGWVENSFPFFIYASLMRRMFLWITCVIKLFFSLSKVSRKERGRHGLSFTLKVSERSFPRESYGHQSGCEPLSCYMGYALSLRTLERTLLSNTA